MDKFVALVYSLVACAIISFIGIEVILVLMIGLLNPVAGAFAVWIIFFLDMLFISTTAIGVIID